MTEELSPEELADRKAAALDKINSARISKIRFTKLDGTERTLHVLHPSLIPQPPEPPETLEESSKPKRTNPTPADCIRVYDVNDGWRTVKVANIIEIKQDQSW